MSQDSTPSRTRVFWTAVGGVVAVTLMVALSLPDEDATENTGASPAAGEVATADRNGADTESAPAEETAHPDEGRRSEPEKVTEPATSTKPAPAKPTPKPKSKLWPVVRVADGDTVTVRFQGREESIRIIGIDTPETVDPNTPDECWGEQASAAAHRMLEGRKVGLVFDPTQGRRDAYDRLLAYVQVPGLGDFGLAQIRRGNAVEYTYDTAYQRQARYRAAEQRARQADRGLWPVCGGADKPLRQPKQPGPRKAEPKPLTGRGSGGGACAAGYEPCVAPGPPDLDCPDVDGPIRVTGDDPHGLDRDGDGVACES